MVEFWHHFRYTMHSTVSGLWSMKQMHDHMIETGLSKTGGNQSSSIKACRIQFTSQNLVLAPLFCSTVLYFWAFREIVIRFWQHCKLTRQKEMREE